VEARPAPRPLFEVPPVERPRPGRLNVFVFSLASFCLIVFGVWVFSAGKRYREEYAQTTPGWQVGSTRTVEVTLVRDDRHNLGCASDAVVAGLHCGNRRDLSPAVPSTAESPLVLQPYNTVGGELFLGAGLWTSPELQQGSLPAARFSVVCNYHAQGIIASALIRFDERAPFSPVGRTVSAGTLTDCVLPR
jgi:hypothetical protein